jgi:hypothetical protein
MKHDASQLSIKLHALNLLNYVHEAHADNVSLVIILLINGIYINVNKNTKKHYQATK